MMNFLMRRFVVIFLSIVFIVSCSSNDGGGTITIGNTTLSDATEGKAYSHTFSASGGNGKYTWSITNGSLPNGITLNASSGKISGSPANGTSGDHTFTIHVEDNANKPAKGNAQVTLTVKNIVGGTITIGNTTLSDATEGQAYSHTFSASGGNGSYTWSITNGSLPNGIALNASSGKISGSPANGTSTGSPYNFEISVQDNATPSATGSENVTLIVNNNNSATLWASNIDNNNIAGIAYDGQNVWVATTASGGRGPSYIHKLDNNGNVSESYTITGINLYINGLAANGIRQLFSFDQFRDVLMEHSNTITSTVNTISQGSSGLSNGPRTLTFGNSNLWTISNSNENELHKVNPSTLIVTQTLNRSGVPDLTGIAWVGSQFWGLGTNGELYRLAIGASSVSLTSTNNITGFPSLTYQLAYNGQDFLVSSNNCIYKVSVP